MVRPAVSRRQLRPLILGLWLLGCGDELPNATLEVAVTLPQGKEANRFRMDWRGPEQFTLRGDLVERLAVERLRTGTYDVHVVLRSQWFPDPVAERDFRVEHRGEGTFTFAFESADFVLPPQ